MREKFQLRIDLFHQLLNEIQGIKCEKPKGAFYLFANIKTAMHIVGVASSEEFQKKWLLVLMDIISEIASEKINNIKEFEEKETVVKAEKINGKWDIITKN